MQSVLTSSYILVHLHLTLVCEEDMIIIPIRQMRKLRLGETEALYLVMGLQKGCPSGDLSQLGRLQQDTTGGGLSGRQFWRLGHPTARCQQVWV